MKKKVFIQSLKWFLPLLFITFINGKIFFTHSHLINDLIVVHTHPFHKSDSASHNHTTKELISIEFHTNGYSSDTVIPIFELDSPTQYLTRHDYRLEDNNLYLQEINTYLLRAPPYFS